MQPQRRALNAREFVFNDAEGHGLNSSIRVMTAGGKGVGRSETFQNLHLSEVAFWPGDKLGTFTGLMQAVPDKPETMVIVESTANGFDFFKDLWDAAVAERNDFIPVFCAWWELPEYRRPCGDGFMLTLRHNAAAHVFPRRRPLEYHCLGQRGKAHLPRLQNNGAQRLPRTGLRRQRGIQLLLRCVQPQRHHLGAFGAYLQKLFDVLFCVDRHYHSSPASWSR